jgi:dienelactone hydrolase
MKKSGSFHHHQRKSIIGYLLMFKHSLLIMVLSTGLLSGCEQIVLDASDPLENSGAYNVAVGVADFDTSTSDTNVPARMYYPTGTFANNSLGLVILLPGFSASYDDYEIYARHLASHGFIVLGMDYVETSADSAIGMHPDKATQVTEAINYALNSSGLKASINSNKIAAMGHSLGGKIAFYAAAIDSRIKVVIAMDPSNAGGPPCLISPANCANYPVAANPARGEIGIVKDIQAASLIFRSQPDGFTNPEAEFNAYYFYYGSDGNGTNGAPSIATYIDMGSAAHASYLPTLISFVPTIVKRDAVAWLQFIFNGTDNSTYFSGAKMQADISAGRVAGFASR